MIYDDFFYVGKVVSKFSYKGECLILYDTDSPTDFLMINFIYILENDSLIKYDINKCKLHKNKFFRIKIEDANSDMEIEKFINKKVFLPKKLLPKLSGNAFYYYEIIGFVLKNNDYKTIGKVLSVDDSLKQPIVTIKNKKNQFLIPLHRDIVIKMDRSKQELILNLAEGLDNINN
tara:strand:- start:14461 stop:14985 length:525 start_codon:yes stop_codon:yes gene_type:complete